MKNYLLTFGIIFGLFLTGCANSANLNPSYDQKTKEAEKTSEFIQSATPSVFFHGYSGGDKSFGSMLKRLEKNKLTKKQLVLTVQEDGTIKQQGTWNDKAQNPTVQVLFENNKSTQENQSKWIRSVLGLLHDTFDVQEVNIVGHSMGSVSTLDYLEQYTNGKNQPKVKKVVMIAGPFNDFIDTFDTQSKEELLANGPNELSNRYLDYVSLADEIPKTIKFQVISGQKSDKELSDGSVPLSSSLSIIPILQKQGFHVENKIILGKKAQHSQLHENEVVDDDIRHFLWGK